MYKGPIEDITKDELISELEKNKYNITATARQIGCHRKTVYKKIKKFGIIMDGAKPSKTKVASEDLSDTSGISLRGANISSRKPHEESKRLLYSLNKDEAYPLSILSTKWKISEESLKKKAKQFNALCWLEQSPGDWIQCVLHPETAEKYNLDSM